MVTPFQEVRMAMGINRRSLLQRLMEAVFRKNLIRGRPPPVVSEPDTANASIILASAKKAAARRHRPHLANTEGRVLRHQLLYTSATEAG
jgi:hypothetical protein